jgi:hypothetical protein
MPLVAAFSLLIMSRIGLLFASGDSRDAEILALRHQILVLQRQIGRPRFTDSDRTILALLDGTCPSERCVSDRQTRNSASLEPTKNPPSLDPTANRAPRPTTNRPRTPTTDHPPCEREPDLGLPAKSTASYCDSGTNSQRRRSGRSSKPQVLIQYVTEPGPRGLSSSGHSPKQSSPPTSPVSTPHYSNSSMSCSSSNTPHDGSISPGSLPTRPVLGRPKPPATSACDSATITRSGSWFATEPDKRAPNYTSDVVPIRANQAIERTST